MVLNIRYIRKFLIGQITEVYSALFNTIPATMKTALVFFFAMAKYTISFKNNLFSDFGLLLHSFRRKKQKKTLNQGLGKKKNEQNLGFFLCYNRDCSATFCLLWNKEYTKTTNTTSRSSNLSHILQEISRNNFSMFTIIVNLNAQLIKSNLRPPGIEPIALPLSYQSQINLDKMSEKWSLLIPS